MAELQHAAQSDVKHSVDIEAENAAMTIKNRIRLRMDDLDLKVVEVAKGAGVTPSAVYQWLAGDTEPGLEAIVGLSEVLKTYVRWLVFGRGAKDRGSMVALEPDEAALMLAYRELADETKQAVYEIAVKLAASEKKKGENRD